MGWPIRAVCLASLVELLSSVALASPTAEPQRALPWSDVSDVQAELFPGWRALGDADGVRAAWGRGIAVDVTSDARAAEQVMALVRSRPALFGLGEQSPVLRSVQRSEKLGIVYVELDIPREGLLPWRGGLSLRIKHGRLVAWRSGSIPSLPVQGALSLPEEAAASLARQRVGRGQVTSVEPLLFPTDRALRRAWLVRVAAEEPTERWVLFLDGQTGQTLYRYDELARISGTVEAEHHERNVSSPLVVSPLPLARVEAAGLTAITDAQGAWELDAEGPYTTSLSGEYLTMIDHQGGEAVLVGDGPTLQWIPDEGNRSEIDNYVFLHQVKAWGETAVPEVPWVWGPITTHVRQGFNWCNAFWLGWEVHFHQGGGNCWDPAQNADIAYHEWGHGLHYHSLLGGHFDLSFSEGAADVMAFLLTGDPEIAAHFYKNGNPMRVVTELRRYPDDMGELSHENGRIFSGAMWDLWRLLALQEGEEQGRASFEALFTGTLKGGPDIAGSYVEALVVDDDDGDLENGTPHICALSKAFGRHGLGPLAEGWTLSVEHAPVEAWADEPVQVQFTLQAERPECLQLQYGSAEVAYRVDGGSWQTLEGIGQDDVVTALLPGQPAGSRVEYRASGRLDDGTPWALPPEGEPPLSYVVQEIPAEATPKPPSEELPSDEGARPAAGGCGCEVSPGPSGVLWLLGLLALRRASGLPQRR